MEGKGKSSNDQGSSPASSMAGLEEISGSTLDLELHPKMILTVIRITVLEKENKERGKNEETFCWCYVCYFGAWRGGGKGC